MNKKHGLVDGNLYIGAKLVNGCCAHGKDNRAVHRAGGQEAGRGFPRIDAMPITRCRGHHSPLCFRQASLAALIFL